MIHPSATAACPLPKPMEECDASGIHLEESRATGMNDLKDELASLRIDRAQPRRGKWGLWITLFLLLVAASAAGLYVVRTKPELLNFAAVEVEPVQASVQNTGGPSAGTPILTASGYLVARKQSVISSKIQGRLSELHVEEGSFVRGGEVIARLEDADYVAAIAKAKADIEYAKANLAEMQRQARLAARIVQRQSRLAGRCWMLPTPRCALAQATVDQDEANLQDAAGAAGVHQDSRALRWRRHQEDDGGGRERGAHSAGRERLDFIGSHCRHRRHEFAGGRSRRQRSQCGATQFQASRRRSRCRRFRIIRTRACCGR